MYHRLSVEELAEIASIWAIPCRSCDDTLPYRCTCPQSNPRPVITRLLEEIKLFHQLFLPSVEGPF